MSISTSVAPYAASASSTKAVKFSLHYLWLSKSGRSLVYRHKGTRSATRAELVAALSGEAPLQSQLRAVCSPEISVTDCVLTVLTSAVDFEDMGAGEALVKDDDTLQLKLEASKHHLTTPAARGGGGKSTGIFVRVELPQRKCQPSRFPALPSAVWFFPATDGDGDGGAQLLGATGEPLQQATLRTSGTGQPVFLEGSSLRALNEWASGPLPCDDDASAKGRLLVLAGPPKSGKSTALDVLPGLIAARCSVEEGRRKPVFLQFTFPSYSSMPQDGANSLIRSAGELAQGLEFDVFTCDNAPTALAQLPRVLTDLARGIHEAGGELVLLLDDAEAPLLHRYVPHNHWGASIEEQRAQYLLAMGRTLAALRGIARIAITGDRTLTLLRALQTLPTEDPSSTATSASTPVASPKLRLWDCMTLVQLGATPPPASALAVARELIRHSARKWVRDSRSGGKALASHVSAERLLAWLALEPGPRLPHDPSGATIRRAAEPWAAKAASTVQGIASSSCAAAASASTSHGHPQPPSLTTPHPGLLSDFLSRMYGPREGDRVDACVFSARGSVEYGVWDGTLRDAAVAAQRLTQHQRACLHAVATGRGIGTARLPVTDDDAKYHAEDEEELLSFVRPFCQPTTSADGGGSSGGKEATLRMLPPYDTLFGAVLLNGRGDQLVQWKEGTGDEVGSRKGQWVLGERLRERLRVFTTLHARAQARLLAREDGSAELRASQAISKAVLEAFAEGGVGVPLGESSSTSEHRLLHRAPTTIAELAAIPAARAVFKTLVDQPSYEERRLGGDKLALEESVDQLARCLGEALVKESVHGFGVATPDPDLPSKQDFVAASPSLMGLQLLAWAYQVSPTEYIADTQFVTAGLKATLVDAAAEAAVDTWRGLGFPVSPEGVPILPVPPAARGTPTTK